MQNQMRDMIKPAFILFAICLVVGLLLSFAHNITKGIIYERNEAQLNDARKEVLSLSNNAKFEFVKYDDWKNLINAAENYKNIKDVYKAMIGETFQAYVVTAVSNGFGGPMEVMIGISASGRVYGVKIVSNQETPGLGSKATDENFTSQFKGLPVNAVLKVVKSKTNQNSLGEIQAVTGATVSSKAVTSAVQTAIKLIDELGNAS